MVKHPIRIDGLAIIERREQDFLSAMLRELSGGLAALRPSHAAARRDGTLLLFQPVQRVYHLAVLAVSCEQFGWPRLDPQRIAGAGLVVRRLARDSEGRQLAPLVTEGWMRAGGRVLGWTPLGSAERLDPDPKRRRPAIHTGQRALDRMVAGSDSGPAESVSALFVAPPEVCEAARQTILYGVIPTASAEITETAEQRTYDPAFVREHLFYFLKAHEGRWHSGQGDLPPAGSQPATLQLPERYRKFLQQIQVELNAFGEGPHAGRMRAALNRIRFGFSADPPFSEIDEIDDEIRPAAEFLRQHVEGFINRNPPNASVPVPQRWYPLSAEDEAEIVAAAKAVLDDRLQTFNSGTTRFEDSGDRYVLRAFVRVRSEDDCPERLWWSDESEAFAIAPWFENGPIPPHRVNLPDITTALKPNVVFHVPARLFDFLNANDPKDLLDGKGKEGGGLGLNWICGFNIPIITICAFIMLSVILSLLNIVFFWLPLVKICIPFPFKKRS